MLWATLERGADGPLPNLKGGHSTRADLKETALVVKPLVRERDGLNRFGLRRLWCVRNFHVWKDSEIRTLEGLVVESALRESPASCQNPDCHRR